MTRDGEARIGNLELELRRALRRLEQVEDAAARALQTATERPPEYGDYLTEAAVWVKTTSSITARSSATYGSGSAKIQTDSGTAFVDNGATITLKNGTDKTIASGSYVLAVWALGKWWAAVPGSCSNLS